MAFKYRLERVLNLREQELEKVKAEFQEAAAHVLQVENKIKKNKQDQSTTQKDLVTPAGLQSPTLYINRLNHLKKQLEVLAQDLIRAKEVLEQVRGEMIEAQQKTEALKKHKEKQKGIYNQAELKKEENELNELALIMNRLKEDGNAEG
jgi:flagellar export protein FliJ